MVHAEFAKCYAYYIIAAYLEICKGTLEEGTAVVLIDFAGNYSLIVQVSIGGFYWDNSQATIHPFKGILSFIVFVLY